MKIVMDMETDALYDAVTKIHCFCYYDIDTHESITLTEYSDIVRLLGRDDLTIIGHNIIRYDVPVIEKILGIDMKGVGKVDTLALSWYLYPELPKHGLKDWGDKFYMGKLVIEEWEGRVHTLQDYIDRCERDVMINVLLWDKQIEFLQKLYPKVGDMQRFLGYLNFKLDCAREQEIFGWRIDKEKVLKGIEYLEKEKEEKAKILREGMPEVIKTRKVVMPTEEKMKTKKGELSERAKKWYKALEEQGKPEYYIGSVDVEVSREKGNPRSHDQIKAWLMNLGWKPETFKYVEKRPIPQISLIDGSDICPSVKALYDRAPILKNLEGFFIISHRIGLLTAFRDAEKELVEKHGGRPGWVKAEIGGLTNTLRFQHMKPCVNLPTVGKPYGELIRGILLAPSDEWELCGADCKGLEESTKHHYIMPYDPEYVAELRTEGFDAHLDMAGLAGYTTEEEVDFYKNFDKDKATNGDIERYKRIKEIRSKAKKVNFAATYGAGPPKIALTASITEREAQKLHRVYWVRNSSINRVAHEVKIEVIEGKMWLLNPVSKFWYSLRAEKDKFSTLNQGTAVYCFDSWARKVRSKGLILCGQFHDELVSPVLKGYREEVTRKLTDSIVEANSELQLNIKLEIDIQFGDNYADIH